MESYAGFDSTITAIHIAQDILLAGNESGQLLNWEIGQPHQVRKLGQGQKRPVESIQILRDDSLERIFYTDTSASLHAQVLGDAFACQYQAGGQTIRRARAAHDWIIGMNEPRDRLFCWPTGDPTATPRCLVIGPITHHSIQDIALVPHE